MTKPKHVITPQLVRFDLPKAQASPEAAERAMMFTLSRSTDVDDARMLLDMLGLMPVKE